jgi:hypothetical protein
VTQAPTGDLPALAPSGDPLPARRRLVAEFVVDEYGWELCSPELAGDLGRTP